MREDGFARRGEIYTLYLLDAYLRCGVGRRLLLANIDQIMAAAGSLSMCVWVLAANPTREFYERLSGVVLSTRDIGFAGRHLDEVCCLWTDLRHLEALEEYREKEPFSVIGEGWICFPYSSDQPKLR